MADDITLNSGSGGATLATDEIASVHHQRVKVQYGADGSATDVSDTNPLPIDDAGGSLTVDNAALSVTGGGVEASALRVTVASDSTGVLSIDDNGGSITVDGTITANLSATDNAVLDQIEVNTSYGDSVGGGTEAAALRVTLANDSTGLISVDDNGGSLTVDNAGTFATQSTLQANSGVDIGDVDVLTCGAITPGTGAGNLGKAEDAAHSTGDVGVMSLAVRKTADGPHSGTDGDYEPLQTDENGYLKVNIKAGAGSGGTASTDDAAFTAGSGSGTPMMGFATSDTVNAGDVGVLAMDTDRNLKISIEADNAGIGGGTQYTEDAAAAANPIGNMNMVVRADSLAGVTTTDGDNIALRGTNNGELYVKQTDAVPVTDNGGSLTVDGTITANLSATDNAVLDQIEVNTSYGDSVGGGTESAALRVTIANDSTGLISIDDNGGSITVDSANLVTIAGAVSGSEMQVDVVASLPAGTNNIGDVDIASSIPAGTNVIGDVGISGARTSGGTTLYKNIDVDESEDQVKATAGQIYWINAINLAASVRYLKIYNATAASVTVGTTVPDLTFPIPTQGDTNGAGFVLSIPNGIAFGTAITIAATTGVADADTGAPGANEVIVNLGYA